MKTLGIDIHRHCIPKGYVEAVRRKSVSYNTEVVKSNGGEALAYGNRTKTKLRNSHVEPELIYRDIESAGLEYALISVFPHQMYCWATEDVTLAACRTINESLFELAAGSSGKVYAMGTVPYQFPALAVHELEGCVKSGMRSIQMPSNVNGRNLDDPSFYPFFEAAEGLGVFIFVHPSDALGAERLKQYHLINLIGFPADTSVAFASLMFGGVMDRFPGLKFCFAHGGGAAPYLIGRWIHGHQVRSEAKVSVKEGPEYYFRRSYFDSLTHDSRSLGFLVDLVGSERVMVGSDWPADMGTNQPLENIRSLPLSCLARERILRGNILQVLGIDE